MSQYFDNDNNIKHNKKIIEFYFNDKNYNLYSDNGVFSKDKFDYGTRLLLDSIDISKLSGNVLDLGCGIGVVGIILGTINKNINIDMIDINERAISLVRDNLTLNKVKANVFSSDVYSNVNKKYDYIIGMKKSNVINIKRIVREDVDNKIYRLLDFSDTPRDIADPWYTGNFENTFNDIVEGCNGFLKYLKDNNIIDK